jgi:hypothetical protein
MTLGTRVPHPQCDKAIYDQDSRAVLGLGIPRPPLESIACQELITCILFEILPNAFACQVLLLVFCYVVAGPRYSHFTAAETETWKSEGQPRPHSKWQGWDLAEGLWSPGCLWALNMRQALSFRKTILCVDKPQT